jgi:hypothetical protein
MSDKRTSEKPKLSNPMAGDAGNEADPSASLMTLMKQVNNLKLWQLYFISSILLN